MSTTCARALVVSALAIAIALITLVISARAASVTDLEGYPSFWRQCINYECPRQTDKCMARCVKRANKRSKE
jgi:hypothetical protein